MRAFSMQLNYESYLAAFQGASTKSEVEEGIWLFCSSCGRDCYYGVQVIAGILRDFRKSEDEMAPFDAEDEL